MRSNRGTRENALEVFDRTFAITIALQVLATLVAFIGILSTLMSLQLERSREIGVLRSTGMTRRQLWRLSLLETGLIGSVAGLLAMPTGLLLAIILIYIINLRSFGWTLEMQLDIERIYAGVSGSASGGPAGRPLPRMAHGQDPAGGCAARGMNERNKTIINFFTASTSVPTARPPGR